MHRSFKTLSLSIPFAIALSACGSTNSSASRTEANGPGSMSTDGTGTGAGSTSAGTGTGSADPSTSGGDTSGGSTDATGGGPTPGTAEPAASGAGGGSSSGASGAGTEPAVPSGLLTAGAWDDNRNFSRFMGYRSALQSSQVAGILPISDADHAAAEDASLAPAGERQKLDVSFVIDTTGSMGDEIAYLKSEFLAISNTVKTTYPNADPRWSLVLYRDLQDDYVVRSFDFSDAQTFQTNLAAQSASGGGDFPEAPDRGLAATAQFAWRSDPSTARLLFWVADAPHHVENAQPMAAAINQIRAAGIHIYPVASSGVDEFTELTMRSAAQLTLGRYLFLTNDSGIGGPHKEPSIPCYFVTKLDNAILRVVDIELTGVYREPKPSEVIRTGGNPQNGACKLDSGAEVIVF